MGWTFEGPRTDAVWGGGGGADCGNVCSLGGLNLVGASSSYQDLISLGSLRNKIVSGEYVFFILIASGSYYARSGHSPQNLEQHTVCAAVL